ncbi:MAG: CHRD domain-containing protein [Verrucomicrobiaceae bacterium]|nr:CHRD domain-containing protein [Verrucomicrobiaceae bacterium]
MNTRLLPALGLVLLAHSALAAPTQLAKESFDGGGIGYTTSIVEFDEASLPVNDFFMVQPNNGTKIAGGTITGGDGTNMFAAEDIDATGSNPTQSLTTNSFNISGKTNLSVKILLAAPGTGGSVVGPGVQTHYDWAATASDIDFVRVEASLDGGPFNRLVQFSPLTNTLNQPLGLDSDGDGLADTSTTNLLTHQFREFDLPISTGGTVQVRLVMHSNATNEYICVDNIRIFGESAATAAPSIAGVPTGVMNYTEGSGAQVLASALTVTDTDSTNLTGASIVISQNLVSTEDVLAVTPSGSIQAGDVVYTAGTGTLTITRTATLANYQTVLRTLTYQNTNVTAPSTALRHVRFSVSDGTNNSNLPIREVQPTDTLVTQALPFTESFETDGRGTRYAINGRFTGPSTAIFERTTLTGATNVDGTMGIASEDTELNADSNNVEFQLAANGSTGVTASVRLGAAGAVFDTGDLVAIEASVNGAAYSQVAIFRSTGGINTSLALDTDNSGTGDGTALGTAMQDFTFNMPTATTLGLRVRCVSNAAGERIFIDRIFVRSPPTVTSSTTPVLASASTVTITGTTFDATTPGNNTVVFNNGATGTVTAATTTQLTVTFGTKPTSAGPLTAIVTTPFGNSGSAVQVATVTPVVSINAGNIATNATSMTISGFGFSTTPGNNTVTFSPSGTGTVTAATATTLTVTSLANLPAGTLNASVTSNSVLSGPAVQVANVTGLITQFNLIGTAGPGLLPGNETPAVTGGTGGEIGAGITFYSGTNTLTLNVGWGSSQGFTDLTSSSNNAHIHGATTNNFGNNGVGDFRQTAGVIVGLTRSSSAASGGVFSPNTVTLTSGQVADLFNGKYYINIHTVNNGGGELRGFLVPANVSPSFTKGSDQTVDEDAGPQTVSAWATSISPGPVNESAQTVSFAITGNTNPSLFSAGPAVATNGTLTYTPAAAALGNATISVRADDNGSPVASSAAQTFVITVQAPPPPDYSVTTVSGVLTITDDAGNGDMLSISEPTNGSIRFTASGRTFSLNGNPQITGNSGDISLSGITSIVVNAAAGADTINLGGFTGTTFPSLTVNGGTSDDTVNFFNDITFGSGNHLDVDLQNDAPSPGTDIVAVQNGADLIATGTGTITVRASDAINIINASSLRTQSGSLIVQTSKSILVNSASSLQTQDGALTVEANQQTPSTSGNFFGINVDGPGTMIRTTGFTTMTVGGKGGDASGGYQYGLIVNNGAQIIGGTSGSVVVNGTGGDSTNFLNRGITVYGTNSKITSNGAAVSVNGRGGANGSYYGIGIAVLFGGEISSVGDSLQIIGTGAGAEGSGFNMGIELGSGTITTTASNLGISGTPGPGEPVGGGGSWGLFVGASSTVSNTASPGTLTLISRSVSIDATATVSANASTGSIVFDSNDRDVDLGGADATTMLGLTDAELDRVTSKSIRIAGLAATISAPITRSSSTNFTLNMNSVTATASGTDIDLAGGTFRPQAGLSMPMTGQLPDTGFPQLKVDGLINLSGVDLSLNGTTNPNGNLFDSYVIVNNDSSDAITGTFNSLPEGSYIPWPPNPALTAQISYVGGTGNDVMLTLLNPFEVTTSANSGPGSLRAAVASALAAPGENTILFSSALSDNLFTLASEITLNDPDGVVIDASNIRHQISGNNANRLFTITGGTAKLRGFWMVNGNPSGDGGAILNQGTLTLESCAFSENTGTLGGAIRNDANLYATNCTFTNNTSTDSGGAIYNHDHGYVSLTHCTIAFNNSGSLGSVTNAGHHAGYVANCIIWGDSGSASLEGEFERAGNNICDRFSTTPAGIGPAFITADPILGGLGQAGGNTPTMSPQLGSPAIDQALVLIPAVTVDQRGVSRPKGIRPDIGAVEGSVLIVTTARDEIETPGTGLSLREAVAAAADGDTITFDRAVFTGSNTITLVNGPLNPQHNCNLDATDIPGGITIVHALEIYQQPQSQSLAAGANASFNVFHENFSGGFAYRWRKNGSDQPAQITDTLGILGVGEPDEGLYDVVISEAPSPGTITTNNVTLTPLQITSAPASLVVDGSPVTIQRITGKTIVAVGAKQTLSVVAVGPASPPLTYQWSHNGKKITGATRSSYDIPKVALTHAGFYTCVALSGTSGSASATTDLAVVDTKAKTINLNAGTPFIARLVASGAGLAYSWKRDGSPIMQNNRDFILPAVTGADTGLYTCTVSFLSGSDSTITNAFNTQLNVTDAVPQLDTLVFPPATIGQTYYYKVPVQNISGAPATSFSLTGTLPKGIVFNKTTGVFSGRPTASKPGGYSLTVRAINSKGPSLPATDILTVNIVPSTAVGTFAGPIERSTTINNNFGGRFDLTTTATGSFSGSITLGNVKRSFKNQLLLSSGTGDVILRGNIPGLKDPANRPMTAYVEVFATEQLARLTLIDFMFSPFQSDAWRKAPTATAATYTLRLDPGTVVGAPQGYGFSTLKASARNSVTITGKLPDGSSLTGSTFIGANGQVLIFQMLYKNKGSLVGQYLLTGTDITGTLTWNKLLTTGTIYKDPFGPINVTAAGGAYTGFSLPNAKLTFTLGGLTPDFSQLLTISPTRVVAITAPVTNSTKLTSPIPATGAFNGSFISNGLTAPYVGQFVKIGATTEGYGYFLLPTASGSTAPKLSGKVMLGTP